MRPFPDGAEVIGGERTIFDTHADDLTTAADMRIEPDAVPYLSAQQFVHGFICGLADDVPHGGFDC